MPAFALDLDPSGIRLLRQDGDTWTPIDRVGIDDPALSMRLKEMRDAGVHMAKGGAPFATLVVIPGDQILYTRLEMPRRDAETTDEEVARALDGLTPCPIDETVFDWQRDGDQVQVAALDVNTISEAESFAVAHGFNPLRFTAWPERGEFPGSPDFGPAKAALAAEETPPPVVAAAKAPPPSRRRTPYLPEIRKNYGPILGAVAALSVMAAMVWTAWTLIAPNVPELPEVAATPQPQPEEEIEEPRPEPRRTAPTLTEHLPLPPFPGPLTAPEIRSEMTVRQMARLPAITAPDPDTEVGILSSADIWQRPPPPLIEPPASRIASLYLAAVDPEVVLGDAFALVEPIEEIAPPGAAPLPPEPGQVFALDERGLVIATPEGALTPDGILVILGRPARVPPTRPTTAIVAPDAEMALALAGKTPRPRPADLIERNERAQLGGRTRLELAKLKPRARPTSAQQSALAAAETSPSPLAVAVSRAPSRRPDDFAAIVAAAQQALAERPETETAVVAASAAVVAPVQPTIPSSASIARQATIEDAINLRRLNLIGVYGSASDRRALIRLPSGRYVKVQVGDRIDGGQVAAIGEDEIRYVKGGKTQTLKMPSS